MRWEISFKFGKLLAVVLVLSSCDSMKDEQISENDQTPENKQPPENEDVKREVININEHNFDEFRKILKVGIPLNKILERFGEPDEKGDQYIVYYNWKPNYVANAARQGVFGLRIKHSEENVILQWVWLSQ